MDAHKDNALRKKYSTALMSNHKWRKFFITMANYGKDFSGIEYRFTDTKNILYGHAPSEQQVWCSAIDDPVEGAGCPIEYKHIESIYIPKIYTYTLYENGPKKERRLNLSKFLNALEKVGVFPITRTPKGLVIHGYKY